MKQLPLVNPNVPPHPCCVPSKDRAEHFVLSRRMDAQWEYAARGGLEQKKYPWGDELTPGGRHLCNIWQGTFPHEDPGEDGHTAPAPLDAFPPNGYGLYMVTGNAWGRPFHRRAEVDERRFLPLSQILLQLLPRGRAHFQYFRQRDHQHQFPLCA